MLAAADRCDRAVVDARRDSPNARFLQPPDDLFRPKPRGDVDVVDRVIEKLVADRASDVARQAVLGAERLQQAPHAAALAPFGRVQPQLHRSFRDRLTIIAAVAPQILRPSQMIS